MVRRCCDIAVKNQTAQKNKDGANALTQTEGALIARLAYPHRLINKRSCAPQRALFYPKRPTYHPALSQRPLRAASQRDKRAQPLERRRAFPAERRAFSRPVAAVAAVAAAARAATGERQIAARSIYICLQRVPFVWNVRS